MEKGNYRIGIVGGMGPMAGVALQQLIIENTPAPRDQDHIEVVCFTNPRIPDRTKSLKEDRGEKFTKAIVDSIQILQKTGVNCILMPCNTAHVRFDQIQKAVPIPIINIIDATFRELRGLNALTVGLLATNGTINSKIFDNSKNVKIITPTSQEQKKVTKIIYQIKSGKYDNKQIASSIDSLIEKLTARGAEAIILGCTELSLYFPLLKSNRVVDPLTLLAKEAVDMARTTRFSAVQW
ncbi:MAG: hypothetical protein A3D44_02975 [Candidatus Staskawiczbacteria bacterium RIFCSPHIGHO2_02_FULL_42_22]|uniref:Aspartate racemase n=1 Tax=Candidatus Staskawiczbacteria bacterium RIFCSPHIGHO2_02_FULL_42_22 TaxID=1802207 RepID=A0A1G2I6X2_9BACT|nr:MAG: hypothetical protein A3D44_02975 [Candidatus Staskawiczbacteria bacterium RIFCSPHIGHO2_02_FULL_42_22]